MLVAVHGSAILRAESEQMPKAQGEDIAHALAGKLGVLSRPSQNPHCAAVCLSSSLIATPGHCVRGTNPTPGKSPGKGTATLKFTLTPPERKRDAFDVQQASSTFAKGVVLGGGTVSFRAPIEADRDWAILRLRQPICERGGLSFGDVQDIDAETGSRTPLWVAQIQRQTKTHAAHFTVRKCKIRPANTNLQEQNQTKSDFAVPSRLLFHNCDAGAIASGSPLISFFESGPQMVAMHVGTYVRSRVVKNDQAITQRLSSRPIAQIAVKASEFTRPVFDLVRAK